MKPDWDRLGDAFEGSSSVLIGDVDCTTDEGKEVCNTAGVRGYPTIKYYTAETGPEGESYQGARSFDALEGFVKDKLEVQCDVADPSSCDEKEQGYITKMQAKTAEEVQAQLTRLEAMKGSDMKPELKVWLMKRLAILKQL